MAARRSHRSSIHPVAVEEKWAVLPDYLLCDSCATNFSAIQGSMYWTFCGRVLLSEYETCLDCRADPPHYQGGESYWWYDGSALEVFHGGKFMADLGVLPLLARKLQADLIAHFDCERTVLVGVPPHPESKFRRGYDWVAKTLSQIHGFRVVALLGRRRGSSAQKDLDRTARQKNLLDQLFILPDAERVIEKLGVGATVILVDDLFTTGASLRACSSMLSNAGIGRLTARTFFRD